jgi:hypothetical protein
MPPSPLNVFTEGRKMLTLSLKALPIQNDGRHDHNRHIYLARGSSYLKRAIGFPTPIAAFWR